MQIFNVKLLTLTFRKKKHKMSKKIDQDCLERLLPVEKKALSITLSTQHIATVNENELKSANVSNENLKKNKFTVVKYNEHDTVKTPLLSTRKEIVHPSPTNSTRYRNKSDWNFEDESTSDAKAKHIANDNADQIELHALNNLAKSNDFLSEEDDLFCGDLLKEFTTQNITNGGREMEGQDTITSLSNEFYKKTLNRIKRKSLGGISNKSHSSSNSLNNISNEKDSNKSQSAVNSDATSLNDKVGIFKSLFQNSDSLATSLKSSLGFSGSRNSVKMRANSRGDLNKSILDLVNRISYKEDNQAESSTLKAASKTELTKSDMVYDALSKAINSNDHKLVDTQFVEKVITAVRNQRLDQQRKKDKARKVCLVAEIIVFVFICVMTFFMANSVISILNLIQLKSFNNATALNVSDATSTFSNVEDAFNLTSTDNEIISSIF